MMNIIENLYPVYVRQGRSPKSYKAGFINAEGKTVIQPSFEDARPFREGLASVQLNEKWGAIDTDGKLAIPFVHTVGLDFSNGVAQFENGSLRGLLARDGTVVLQPKYCSISRFRSDGIAYVSDGNHYGFINVRGEQVIPLFFDDAREFSDGVAPVLVNGRWGYIDQRAAFVIEPKFAAAMPFSEGLARVSVDGRWGYIDRNGEFAITPRYATAYDFKMGLAGVWDEKKGPAGYIDKTGKMVIPPAYTYIRPFAEGLAAVTPSGQSFQRFINVEGEQVFPGEYLGAHDFHDGLSRVATLKITAYINHNGEIVWQGPYVDRP
jgi:hypothetical protein